MFIHWRKNLLGLPNTVDVATSTEFLEVQTRPRVLVLTGTRRCPVSSARSAQKFGGKKKNKRKIKNMKK